MIQYLRYIIIFLILVLANDNLFSQQTLYKTERIPLITEGSADDYAPVKYKDGIIFISNRKRGVIDNYEFKDENGESYACFNYYFSKIDPSDGSLNQPELLDVDLASRSNKGPLTFSADEKTMYFTKNRLEPKRFTSNSKPNPVGIYTAHLNGKHWTNIKAFPYCTGKFNYGHPALSADGKRLYFASDTTGGYGGFDIWVCELKDGQWSPPQNMGPNINTAGDEAYPIIHPSGRLYFTAKASSKSRSINYYSEFINEQWAPRELAPDLLGNQASVKYFLGDSLLQQGYYVEERNRHMTIRRFISNFPKFDSIRPIVEPRFCFTFFDKTAPLLDTITMMYEWDFGKGEKVRGAEAYHCFPGIGKYAVDLNVIDKATGQLFFSQASYPFTIEDLKQVRIKFSLADKNQALNPETNTCLINQKTIFSTDISNLKGMKIGQFFWDFGDLDKATGPSATHIFRHTGKYKIICGVVGTDSKNPLKISNYIFIDVKDNTINP
jgi:WD40-like Beta Propeller Repeat/PKD domain